MAQANTGYAQRANENINWKTSCIGIEPCVKGGAGAWANKYCLHHTQL